MIATSEHKKISEFLSYILRHEPDAIGLTLDDQGWGNIDEFINKANQSNEVTACYPDACYPDTHACYPDTHATCYPDTRPKFPS